MDEIAALQRDRQIRSSCESDEIQFYDRSPICTAALARYLGYSLSPFLAGEINRIRIKGVYQNEVFFIRNLGFITNTGARRITFEETLRFETIHEETYREHGFEMIFVSPASVLDRATQVKALVTDH